MNDFDVKVCELNYLKFGPHIPMMFLIPNPNHLAKLVVVWFMFPMNLFLKRLHERATEMTPKHSIPV